MVTSFCEDKVVEKGMSNLCAEKGVSNFYAEQSNIMDDPRLDKVNFLLIQLALYILPW